MTALRAGFLLIALLTACRDGNVSPEHSGGDRKWQSYWARTEDAARDRDPATRLVLDAVAARPGMRVADVGAGAGYFTFKVAAAVGPNGRVLATDIDRDMVDHIRRAAAARKAANVEARVVTETEPRLEPKAWDVVLAVNVYLFWHGVEALGRSLLDDFRRALRPGGRVVVFQDNLFTGESRKTGCFYRHCVSLTAPETVALARQAGLEVERLQPSPNPVGEGMRPGYLLVLRPE